jgi:hypothetical protein
MDGSEIFILATSGATWVKLLVDLWKVARPVCRTWEAPVLAVLSGVLILFLLLLATGQPLTSQTSARAVLAGLMAAGMAMGVTELHKRAREEA